MISDASDLLTSCETHYIINSNHSLTAVMVTLLTGHYKPEHLGQR